MSGFALLGRELRAVGLSAPVAAWLRAVWHFPEHHLPPVPFRVEVMAVPAPADDAPADAPPVRTPGIELPCRVLGERAWRLGGRGAGVCLRLHPGGARIEVWEDGGSVHAALFVAVYEAVRASGLLPLHASVLERGGAATALAAPSGTGKSSTLLTLSRRGWRPVAEDFAWLEPESLRVFGWDRGVHLWPAGRDRFVGEFEGWTMGGDGKLFLPWSAVGAPGPREGRLETVALLARDATLPSGWEPLPERDAVRALWEAVGVPLDPATRATVAQAIPALLRRVSFRRLVLGSTPLEA